jgi:hypothetical protein
MSAAHRLGGSPHRRRRVEKGRLALAQTLRDLSLGFDAPIAAYMRDRACGALGKDPPEQVVAMASLGLLLETHQDYLAPFGLVLHLPYRFQEPVLEHDSVVQGVPLVVIKLVAFGSLAKMLAEPQIVETVLLENRLKRLSVEVLSTPNPRARSDVDYEGDLMFPQPPEERVEWIVGVTDCENRGKWGFPRFGERRGAIVWRVHREK